MTIIPLPHTETADPQPWFRPLPAAWCYICGNDYTHRRAPDFDCVPCALPQRPQVAALEAAMAATSAYGLPELLGAWEPTHVEAVRQIAAVLSDWAGIAERLNARAAAAG